MRRAVLLVLFAAVGLASADDKAEVEKLAKTLKTAKDARAKLAAVEQLGGKGEAATGPLCDALTDRDAKVAVAALAAIEKANPKLYKPLSTLLLDRDLTERGHAAADLARMGVRARPAAGVLVAKLKAVENTPDRGLGFALLKALAVLGADDPEAARQLKAMAVAPKTGDYREGVILALAAWAGDEADRRKELVPALRAGLADPGAVAAALKVAATLGKAGEPLLPALRQLKLSPDGATRDAAAKAVAAIENP